MDFVFLSAHKVFGISQKTEAHQVHLFEGLDPSTSALITGNLDAHWHLLDQHIALASMILRGLVGKTQKSDFEERLEKEIEGIRERRAKTLGNDGILLIEIRGDLEVDIKNPKREVGDLVLCFDAYDKKQLKANLEKRIATVLAAVRIGGAGKYQLEKIADGSYLLAPNGKIIHSFSEEVGTITAYKSSPISDTQKTTIHQYIDQLSKETNLASVVPLFVHSLDRNTDSFRAFISAWSAMEILVNKIFDVYESKLIEELSKISAAPGLKQYLNRISDVMKGKYSLADKFSVISIFLNEENGMDDITTFKKIKKVRDNIFHGHDVPEISLPVTEIQDLFEKYFRNHVDRISA